MIVVVGSVVVGNSEMAVTTVLVYMVVSIMVGYMVVSVVVFLIGVLMEVLMSMIGMGVVVSEVFAVCLLEVISIDGREEATVEFNAADSLVNASNPDLVLFIV